MGLETQNLSDWRPVTTILTSMSFTLWKVHRGVVVRTLPWESDVSRSGEIGNPMFEDRIVN